MDTIHASRHQAIAGTVVCGLILAVAVALWRDRPGAHGGALNFAVVQGDLAKAERLLRRGANPNRTANQPVLVLETALLFAPKNREEMVALLLKHGAEPNARNGRGETPLEQAISVARPWAAEAVKLLVDHGADVNAKDSKGLPPLAYARTHRGGASPAGKERKGVLIQSLVAQVAE